jgi:hypothetical protein
MIRAIIQRKKQTKRKKKIFLLFIYKTVCLLQ